MNKDFLEHWEPREIEPGEAEDIYKAGLSGLCKVCANLGEDKACEVRGFQMDMVPPVWACLGYRPKAQEPEEQVEILRTFTVEVTHSLKIGKSKAGEAERDVRAQSEKELEKTTAASLGAAHVKVKGLKVWVLD